jgi:hypothetical protein
MSAAEPKRREPDEEEEKYPRLRSLVIVVCFGIAAFFAWRAMRSSDLSPPGDAPEASPSPSGEPLAAPGQDAAERASKPASRCVDIAPDAPFLIGEGPARRPAPAPPAEPGPSAAAPDASARRFPDIAAEEPEEEDLSPFAVQVGRGAVFTKGFAVGTLRDAEGGSVASIVTLGLDGRGGKTIRLARSRGDVEAPVVAASGDSILVGLLEPNAGGRALKIAKVTDEQVTWGAELAQGRDESLAFDLAAGASRGIAVWDDVGKDRKRSSIQLATFDPGAPHSVTSARPVTGPKVDADSPRVVVRPGGFWLAYIARAERANATAKPPARGEEERDDAPGGETIGTAWVEMVPLDDNGSPTAAPRRATPKEGNVLAFDLEIGDDGAAILAWRDDDTPTGSSGGRVSTTLVRLGGISEPRVLADEEVGDGVPDLLPGWIAVSNISGPKRLAPMSPLGEEIGPLQPEPSIGIAEPLAATRDAILLARPAGKAIRLSVVRCAAAPD